MDPTWNGFQQQLCAADHIGWEHLGGGRNVQQLQMRAGRTTKNTVYQIKTKHAGACNMVSCFGHFASFKGFPTAAYDTVLSWEGCRLCATEPTQPAQHGPSYFQTYAAGCTGCGSSDAQFDEVETD